ncbi:tetratricopeptide repeat protein [Roseiarcus sp.]|uniref:tetratricopeptide repeat protein n=1 Tax=Roseiarcus sp. TaxID=1969460 RepID=UPI003F94F3B1
MAKDQLGLMLTGSEASARAYDRAVSDYWGLTGDPVGALKQALAADPAFVLGAAAIAGLFLIGGFRGDHLEVVAALAAADRALGGASQREKLHVAAVKALADGRAPDAVTAWEAILVEWPTDALALRFGQDAYFFLGQSLAIRDSVARVLPAWDRGHPLASFVLGAYAFGLEEAGELGRAEAAAREALALNPKDAWATHALAHVLETACRPEEGIAFLKATQTSWRTAHFMAGHNGWHLALYLIDQGRTDEVLADYDRFAAPKLADDTTLDRCDAAALLWRLELAGVGVGDRWEAVARAWRAHVGDHVLAFNDLHAAFAAARSPDPDDAGRLRRSLDAYQRDGRGHNRAVTAEVGRRLIEGVLCYGAGADAQAVEEILPLRYEAFRIGGSHAQRDVLNLTLIAAAERSGQWRLARALLAERAAVRPTAKVRGQYERACARAA